jgi:hypothetical protein
MHLMPSEPPRCVWVHKLVHMLRQLGPWALEAGVRNYGPGFGPPRPSTSIGSDTYGA